MEQERPIKQAQSSIYTLLFLIFAGTLFRESGTGILPKNTLNGTKFRENYPNTDLHHKQLVSEFVQLILIFFMAIVCHVLCKEAEPSLTTAPRIFYKNYRKMILSQKKRARAPKLSLPRSRCLGLSRNAPSPKQRLRRVRRRLAET